MVHLIIDLALAFSACLLKISTAALQTSAWLYVLHRMPRQTASSILASQPSCVGVQHASLT